MLGLTAYCSTSYPHCAYLPNNPVRIFSTVLVLVMVLNPGHGQSVNDFGQGHDKDLRQFDKLTADQNQDQD